MGRRGAAAGGPPVGRGARRLADLPLPDLLRASEPRGVRVSPGPGGRAAVGCGLGARTLRALRLRLPALPPGLCGLLRRVPPRGPPAGTAALALRLCRARSRGGRAPLRAGAVLGRRRVEKARGVRDARADDAADAELLSQPSHLQGLRYDSFVMGAHGAAAALGSEGGAASGSKGAPSPGGERALATVRSTATTRPVGPTRSAKAVVFPPGLAHMSSTVAPGRGRSAAAAAMLGRFWRSASPGQTRLRSAEVTDPGPGAAPRRRVTRTATPGRPSKSAALGSSAVPAATGTRRQPREAAAAASAASSAPPRTVPRRTPHQLSPPGGARAATTATGDPREMPFEAPRTPGANTSAPRSTASAHSRETTTCSSGSSGCEHPRPGPSPPGASAWRHTRAFGRRSSGSKDCWTSPWVCSARAALRRLRRLWAGGGEERAVSGLSATAQSRTCAGKQAAPVHALRAHLDVGLPRRAHSQAGVRRRSCQCSRNLAESLIAEYGCEEASNLRKNTSYHTSRISMNHTLDAQGRRW